MAPTPISLIAARAVHWMANRRHICCIIQEPKTLVRYYKKVWTALRLSTHQLQRTISILVSKAHSEIFHTLSHTITQKRPWRTWNDVHKHGGFICFDCGSFRRMLLGLLLLSWTTSHHFQKRYIPLWRICQRFRHTYCIGWPPCPHHDVSLL